MSNPAISIFQAAEQRVKMPKSLSTGNKPHAQWRDGGFLARTLTPSDANETYLSWIADPELMGALNMPGRKLTLADLREHINQFDQRTTMLVGIFEDGLPAKLIGIFVLTLNLEHRLMRISGFIGEPRPQRGFIAFVKSVFNYLFEIRGVEKIGAQVAITNKSAIAACWALGMRKEGLLKGEIRKFDGSARIDQISYGLLKDDWRTMRKNQSKPRNEN